MSELSRLLFYWGRPRGALQPCSVRAQQREPLCASLEPETACVAMHKRRTRASASAATHDLLRACRSRLWLFLSYIVSFASIVAAVWVEIAHYAHNPKLSSAEKWPGAAGIFQVRALLSCAWHPDGLRAQCRTDAEQLRAGQAREPPLFDEPAGQRPDNCRLRSAGDVHPWSWFALFYQPDAVGLRRLLVLLSSAGAWLLEGFDSKQAELTRRMQRRLVRAASPWPVETAHTSSRRAPLPPSTYAYC